MNNIYNHRALNEYIYTITTHILSNIVMFTVYLNTETKLKKGRNKIIV